ncbi:MerR family DNA-binding transcriptional regulator [Winogradskya consettensis]|uniref:HTH merR-type domain-containing protein n=1 Tax=Winogradskya consettensis TaxID=113560 RepID=A0A919VWY9_9ACTN|nr:hypothetical protein Aco04nite_62550 [Actinoplanes consettensis]
MARASGLAVSALRFYDSAGVLVPAEVDPATGYRRYSESQLLAARLIAGLRRVGMPVAEIARAVAHLPDPPAVRALLDDYQQRLEDGLTDARHELTRLRHLLAPGLNSLEITMTSISLPADALSAALDAVRFAASIDPDLPMINGVLLETRPDSLTLVATDRYRLAVAESAATITGPPTRLVAPLPFIDALRPLLSPGIVTLDLTPATISAQTPSGRLDTSPLDVDFPDHRALTSAAPSADARSIQADAPTLRAAVHAATPIHRDLQGTPYELAILTLDPTGTLLRTADESDWSEDSPTHIAVNREFLLQALAATGPGQLTLELDGPIKPLAVRTPTTYSILMPVRH